MKSTESKNAREFTRVPIHLEVEIRCGDKSIRTDETGDLSMKGIFLMCKETLPVGSLCGLSLFLQGGETPIRIEVKGRVMRSVKNGMGIQFTEIDLEGYDHLQNLLMYNAKADHDQVEEEIHHHLGLKKK